MRRLLIVPLALAVVQLAAGGAAWAQAGDPASVPRVTIAELKQLQASDRVVVVDVRDAQSFAEGHIPGALSIPVDLTIDVSRLKDAKKTIVFYCA